MNTDTALSLKKWAVVGATSNTNKFGCKVYRKLKNCGYEVYAVNPGLEEVLGDKCYPNLAALPTTVEIVNFVVPEAAALQVLQDMKTLGIKTAWFQPGADSKAVLALAKELEIEIIQNCVLVAL